MFYLIFYHYHLYDDNDVKYYKVYDKLLIDHKVKEFTYYCYNLQIFYKD